MSNIIRTASHLQQKLDAELSWRIHELSEIRAAIRQSQDSARIPLLRAGIVLLYAHWEGFFKSAVCIYASLLSNMGLKYADLQDSFIGYAAKVHVNQIMDIKRRLFVSAQHAKNILEIPNQKVKIELDEIVAEIGNLNHATFIELLQFLGLSTKEYDLKDRLIDESLLKRRNDIAHGNYLLIDEQGYDGLYRSIIAVMQQVKSDIEAAVDSKLYMRKGSTAMISASEGA